MSEIDINEYRPWEEEGIDELEFWKRRFLEESERAEIAEAAVNAMVAYQDHPSLQTQRTKDAAMAEFLRVSLEWAVEDE